MIGMNLVGLRFSVVLFVHEPVIVILKLGLNYIVVSGRLLLFEYMVTYSIDIRFFQLRAFFQLVDDDVLILEF